MKISSGALSVETKNAPDPRLGTVYGKGFFVPLLPAFSQTPGNQLWHTLGAWMRKFAARLVSGSSLHFLYFPPELTEKSCDRKAGHLICLPPLHYPFATSFWVEQNPRSKMED